MPRENLSFCLQREHEMEAWRCLIKAESYDVCIDNEVIWVVEGDWDVSPTSSCDGGGGGFQ